MFYDSRLRGFKIVNDGLWLRGIMFMGVFFGEFLGEDMGYQ